MLQIITIVTIFKLPAWLEISLIKNVFPDIKHWNVFSTLATWNIEMAKEYFKIVITWSTELSHKPVHILSQYYNQHYMMYGPRFSMT